MTIKDPLDGWLGIDLVMSNEAFGETMKFYSKEVRNCVKIRNAIICFESLLFQDTILNNTIEEVKADFEASLFLSSHGFYKHSIGALRSAMEVCFEGLFYHFNEEKYSDWYEGKRDRIKIKDSFNSLRKNSNRFKSFDKKHSFYNEVYNILYNQLSLYVHTQGQKALEIEKRNDIVPKFNKKAYNEFLSFYKKVFEIISTSLLILFPKILTTKNDCVKEIMEMTPNKIIKKIEEFSR